MKKFIIEKAIETILLIITLLAAGFFILSLVAIIKAWSFSGISAIVFIASSVWLGLFGLYLYLVNK